MQIFEQSSENLMNMGEEISKLWHFEVLQILPKQFGKHRYELCMYV